MAEAMKWRNIVKVPRAKPSVDDHLRDIREALEDLAPLVAQVERLTRQLQILGDLAFPVAAGMRWRAANGKEPCPTCGAHHTEADGGRMP